MKVLKFTFSVWLISSLMSVTALAKKEDLYDFKNVKFVKNYDADTITVNIEGLHPILGKNSKIRVRGLDTPEIRGSSHCEKKIARYAKRLVKAELRGAKNIQLKNCGKGKYFRLVCDVEYDNKSLKNILFKNKLAYPYQGGKKKSINWCSFRK